MSTMSVEASDGQDDSADAPAEVEEGVEKDEAVDVAIKDEEENVEAEDVEVEGDVTNVEIETEEGEADGEAEKLEDEIEHCGTVDGSEEETETTEAISSTDEEPDVAQETSDIKETESIFSTDEESEATEETSDIEEQHQGQCEDNADETPVDDAEPPEYDLSHDLRELVKERVDAIKSIRSLLEGEISKDSDLISEYTTRVIDLENDVMEKSESIHSMNKLIASLQAKNSTYIPELNRLSDTVEELVGKSSPPMLPSSTF